MVSLYELGLARVFDNPGILATRPEYFYPTRQHFFESREKPEN